MVTEEEAVVAEWGHGDANLCQVIQILQYRSLRKLHTHVSLKQCAQLNEFLSGKVLTSGSVDKKHGLALTSSVKECDTCKLLWYGTQNPERLENSLKSCNRRTLVHYILHNLPPKKF